MNNELDGLEYLRVTPQSMILSAIAYNHITVHDIRLTENEVLDSIPGINLGRQMGHTTTFRKYAEDNPDMTFLVIGTTQALFDCCYRQNKNIIRQGNNIRGKKIDYIIIENSHIFSVNNRQDNEKQLLSYILTNMPSFMNGKKCARIFKIS